ncbi:MAG: valine--tRNA ligase [Candidatus Dojkabacteria bacterium]|nr:MAG: valine--tRNA ligase [Candidatus Dojkabacteria bacterium]
MEKQNKAEQIPKAFDSNTMEPEIYKMWEENDLFRPETLEKKLKEQGMEPKTPFTIPLPPPNANGNLHLGHTCGYSFQDAMGRFNRMRGHPTLLLPGKDHASIQTESVFARILEKQGESKWELGREEFYKRCYEFCMEAAKNAQEQEKRIGLSADWSRDFFTLDPRLTEIIYDTFYKLLDEGLIYRGKYIINWCSYDRTALADIDTIKEEQRGIFAYIIYPFADEADNDAADKKLGYRGIMVATTRPETMLGDTAVAVHPDDERYKEFVGKMLRLPIADREIPLIADEEIDPEFGTGALKATPAHAAVDFEMGERHGLEIINVINEEGKMDGPIPERFKGMDTIECSKALVKELEELGLLHKMEKIKHEVSVCERCGTTIQPIISHQWFLNVKPLAEKGIEAINNGETTIMPAGKQRALIHFFENIKPWCISRQLWWGQRIPVWYSGGKALYDWMQENPGRSLTAYEAETGEKARGSGKLIKGLEKPDGDPDWTGSADDLLLEQEEDIFDTWFSSGQWPYSTLGGPGADDFEKYYPTQAMETMHDILFWWVARMMMLGIYRTGKTPFSRVFLHGMILAPDGTKMSKSKGNGVEPGEIFEKYGADALRMWYYSDALPGSNTPLQEEKIKGHRFFVNKIWNASRFVLMNLDDSEIEAISLKINEIHENDSERLRQFADYKTRIIKYMDDMKFHLGAEAIREYFWGEYCDKHIEAVKTEIADEEIGSNKRIAALAEMIHLMKESMKIMHPFMPYVTEAVWQELKKLELADGWLTVEQIGE